MCILFFDTETTGLPGGPIPGCGRTHSSDNQPRFVELAWAKYIDRKCSGACDMYVRPTDFQMPASVTAYNGITNEKLANEGRDEKFVLDSFMLAVKNADILAGHNIAFDIKVIASRLRDLGKQSDADILCSKPVICTMTSSTKFCQLPLKAGSFDNGTGYKYPSLQELHEKLFGCRFENAHNALSDTLATARCFMALANKKIIKPEESCK